MTDSILFLSAPFALTALLILIHSYLGLHIIERDIIFVDISLSQVATLGAATSAIFFHDSPGWNISVSLIFCCLASILLAVFRRVERKISQETLVGITYALASGFLILVLDQSPHGSEHLKNSLIGNLLFTTWAQVYLVAVVYALVAIAHYFFRTEFWQSTCGQKSSLWIDILFYFLFSVVITFSTHHAGVLVVFSALVIPAALATKQGGSLLRRLGTAWSFGILAAIVSFILSFHFDWPLGAGLVVTFATLFFFIISVGAVQNRH